jgi:DNA modification methylase
MLTVFHECYLVLEAGRFMAINIGTVVSDEGMKFICGDFVKLAQQAKFIFKKDIIWHKPKGTTKWQRGATQFTQNPYPLKYNTNINHEYILIFQKPGECKKISNKKIRPFNKIFTREMAYSVWDIIPINSPNLDEKHVAPYPEEIPSRLIKLYTYKNEIVLDPFAGSGTTCKVAYELGRKSIAVEISKSYCNLIEKKIKNLKFDSFDDNNIYSENADLYLDKIEKKILKNKNELKKILLEKKKFYINNPTKNIKKQLKLFD